MGYHSKGRRRNPDGRLHPIEAVFIVLVVASIVALVVWIISNAGGGHLLT